MGGLRAAYFVFGTARAVWFSRIGQAVRRANVVSGFKAVMREPRLVTNGMMFYSLKRILLKHDPEKWTPVFRKDHAQARI
jgi:hypothetical protein